MHRQTTHPLQPALRAADRGKLVSARDAVRLVAQVFRGSRRHGTRSRTGQHHRRRDQHGEDHDQNPPPV